MIKLPFFRKNGKPPGGRRPADLLAVGKEDLLFNEKFKGLRAMVEQKADLPQMRLLGITSSIAGEGKTVTTSQLGRSLALPSPRSVSPISYLLSLSSRLSSRHFAASRVCTGSSTHKFQPSSDGPGRVSHRGQ